MNKESNPREWYLFDTSTGPADKTDRWYHGSFHQYVYNHIPEKFQKIVVEKSSYLAKLKRLVEEKK